MQYRVITGDILTADIPGVFDAVLCDPPYGLSFMGKEWDHGVPGAAIWRRVYDHLRPGAHLIAFGGTRTHHRLMVAIEDAGYEIRDCLMWLYGSGFPKSHDISKAIDREAGAEREVVGRDKNSAARKGTTFHGAEHKGGWTTTPEGERYITAPATFAARTWDGYGTALKPAWEPAILAMRPTVGTYAANAQEQGVAGLNIDGGRVDIDENDNSGVWDAKQLSAPGNGGTMNRGWRHGYRGAKPSGRWPANVILDPAAADMLGRQSGERPSGGSLHNRSTVVGVAYGCFSSQGRNTQRESDTGTAARFFYTAKASRRERNAGLEGMEARRGPVMSRRCVNCGRGEMDGRRVGKCCKFPEYENAPARGMVANHHPTVKPIDLCQYLATLLLPPDTGRPRRLLVPFSGSGSEMIGALLAGWDEVVGVELNAEYATIANARLEWWTTIARQLTGQPTAARVLEYAGLEDDAEPVDDAIDFGLFAQNGAQP